MKISTLLYFITILPILLHSQNLELRVLPEFGISNPIGDFKEVNVFAKQGFQGGINFEIMRGSIGLGFYAGFDQNNIQFDDLLPATSPNLDITKSSDIGQYNWKQLLVGLGPVVNLKVSDKFNIGLTSKLGVSKFSYPDFGQFVDIAEPLNQKYTLYQTNNEVLDKKLNPTVLSALRLNYKLTDNMNLTLSGNYKYARNVRHSYSYLDASFNPEMSNESLLQSLLNAPTVTEIRECHFNTVGVTLGLSITIGDKPKGKMDPPVPDYPTDGETISIQEADSLTLKWKKEMPNVKKANYDLWLYKIDDSEQQEDSLVLYTTIKRNNQLSLKNYIHLEPCWYRWKVRAVGSSKLKPCPDGCNSIDAFFTISSIVTDQYYELSSQNSGNYVEVGNRLRTCLHPCGRAFPIHCGGGRIYNQDNEVVLEIANMQRGLNTEQYSSDDKGRITFDLRQLPEGYYHFEQNYEHNKKYYLRFKITRSNDTIKR